MGCLNWEVQVHHQFKLCSGLENHQHLFLERPWVIDHLRGMVMRRFQFDKLATDMKQEIRRMVGFSKKTNSVYKMYYTLWSEMMCKVWNVKRKAIYLVMHGEP